MANSKKYKGGRGEFCHLGVIRDLKKNFIMSIEIVIFSKAYSSIIFFNAEGMQQTMNINQYCRMKY